ncbi:hypothetical protein Tco_0374758 [Tanacetum coccineum]
MNDDLEYVIPLKRSLDELENQRKADFSNIYDLLLEECVSKDYHKVKECESLALKLSEIELNLLQKKTDKNNPFAMKMLPKVISKEREHIMEIQDLKASMQDKNMEINDLKETHSVNLPRNRNQAVRNTNVLKPGMFRIASTTTQTRTPQLPHASRNTNPHINKPSSSKLVPKVVPLAVKTATSRQELELLFHHHIAMLRTTEHPSDTYVFTMKMEILLESASNKLLVGDLRDSI